MSGYKTDLISEATMQHQAAEIMKLKEQLAASQAREQQLREALEICKKEMPGDKWDSLYIDGVLALPQDDTALRQWGAKLLRDLVYNRLEGLCNESGMKELLRKADELEAGK